MNHNVYRGDNEGETSVGTQVVMAVMTECSINGVHDVLTTGTHIFYTSARSKNKLFHINNSFLFYFVINYNSSCKCVVQLFNLGAI